MNEICLKAKQKCFGNANFSNCLKSPQNCSTTFFCFTELNFLKVHKVTRSTDFDEIFKLDIGNVLNMMCAKFEVHTTHRSDDPYEFVKFSQKN